MTKAAIKEGAERRLFELEGEFIVSSRDSGMVTWRTFWMMWNEHLMDWETWELRSIEGSEEGIHEATRLWVSCNREIMIYSSEWKSKCWWQQARRGNLGWSVHLKTGHSERRQAMRIGIGRRRNATGWPRNHEVNRFLHCSRKKLGESDLIRRISSQRCHGVSQIWPLKPATCL